MTEVGPTGDSVECFGFFRVENRVGLGVAFSAGFTLEPNDIASCVED